MRAALLALAFATAGCVGTPTPLDPSVAGSVGVPHDGVLTNGVELPVRGSGFRRYRPHGSHYFGNPRLVDAVQRVAAEVERERPGGAPLLVGDLSAQTGGKIPGHHSHRTGRDVDLLYYVTTPTGVPVRSPGFVGFDTDGLARVEYEGDVSYLRLDVEREWLLVKKLMTAKEVGVQWMFMSRGIEALLIDYARARGEDDALVWHAETVMLQPGDSTPHADHMHLRIACTPDEMAAGCEGGGPYWQWLPLTPFPGWLPSAVLDPIAADDPFELGRLAHSDA